MVSSPCFVTPPLLSLLLHPLAISSLLVEEGCVQKEEEEAGHVRLGEWSLGGRQCIQTHTLTRTQTRSVSVVKQALAPLSCELTGSPLSVCRNAAEKEEFHFWSLWRVRMNENESYRFTLMCDCVHECLVLAAASVTLQNIFYFAVSRQQ